MTDSLAEPLSDSDADAFDRSQRAVLRAQMKDLEKLNKENCKSAICHAPYFPLVLFFSVGIVVSDGVGALCLIFRDLISW